MAKKETKRSLDTLVRDAANGLVRGKLNLNQYKERKARHIEVCKQLAALSDEYGGYPICYLAPLAVGSSAHKTSTFNEGYKGINVVRARVVLGWMKKFADKNENPKLFKNTEVRHACTKFFEHISSKDDDFNEALSKMDKIKGAFTYKGLCSMLGMN